MKNKMSLLQQAILSCDKTIIFGSGTRIDSIDSFGFSLDRKLKAMEGSKNPFKSKGFNFSSGEFEIIDPVYDAGVLASSVLPYRSSVPFVVRKALDYAFSNLKRYNIPPRFLPKIDVVQEILPGELTVYCEGAYLFSYFSNLEAQNQHDEVLRRFLFNNDMPSRGYLLEQYLERFRKH